ncbi:hypothetical protein QVD99_008069 [Batrachochytrium dendrobatidis]|nr:hypothetical protein O5D80_004778 [Batrachochytrium dendrobatidis]KAK5665224.1 hypothetical protein QVD99_008069 [Batrachochytrium dendrobatidis]
MGFNITGLLVNQTTTKLITGPPNKKFICAPSERKLLTYSEPKRIVLPRKLLLTMA